MAKLTTKKRNALPKKVFVFQKERRYPIEDLSHARNALVRAVGTKDEDAVRKAVYAKYPELKPKK